jgi:two-component system, OmpR family, response regulator ChvI
MNHPQQGQKKILVVDDEADLTMLCRFALEYHGFNVDTFNDPQEALSNYKPSHYDLIILDIKMPKMDGFLLYNEIKRKITKPRFVFLPQVNCIMRNLEKEIITR